MNKYTFPLSKFPAEESKTTIQIGLPNPEDIYLPTISSFISSFIVYNVLSATCNIYMVYALMALTSSTTVYKYLKPDQSYPIPQCMSEKLQYPVLSGLNAAFISPLVFLANQFYKMA